MLKEFKGSFFFTIGALILAAILGWEETHKLAPTLQMVFLAGVLGVMETSLSLDNAVVNASILKDMDEKWQKRFLSWGIIIAVFGMRIVFPLVIVSVAGHLSPYEAARISITDHKAYEEYIKSAHVGISGFGGAFLMLVGMTFFLDEDREHHWMPWIEKPLSFLARIPFAPYIVTALIVGLVSFMVQGQVIEHGGGNAQRTFLIAGLSGVVAYFVVQKLGDMMGGDEDATGKMVRSGAGAFIYLEFLDASFSFDGVIGAFAITNDILLIALGLGIGAMFVRSMTVALVHGGHLSEFRFLESGAFYAIVALATIMLVSIAHETPEWITGLIGAAFIGAALVSSIQHKKKYPEEYADDDETPEITLPSGDVIETRD